ncbi:hypothetical protein MRX96_046982 [Rhipicephalus microplus]
MDSRGAWRRAVIIPRQPFQRSLRKDKRPHDAEPTTVTTSVKISAGHPAWMGLMGRADRRRPTSRVCPATRRVGASINRASGSFISAEEAVRETPTLLL